MGQWLRQKILSTVICCARRAVRPTAPSRGFRKAPTAAAAGVPLRSGSDAGGQLGLYGLAYFAAKQELGLLVGKLENQKKGNFCQVSLYSGTFPPLSHSAGNGKRGELAFISKERQFPSLGGFSAPSQALGLQPAAGPAAPAAQPLGDGHSPGALRTGTAGAAPPRGLAAMEIPSGLAACPRYPHKGVWAEEASGGRGAEGPLHTAQHRGGVQPATRLVWKSLIILYCITWQQSKLEPKFGCIKLE